MASPVGINKGKMLFQGHFQTATEKPPFIEIEPYNMQLRDCFIFSIKSLNGKLVCLLKIRTNRGYHKLLVEKGSEVMLFIATETFNNFSDINLIYWALLYKNRIDPDSELLVLVKLIDFSDPVYFFLFYVVNQNLARFQLNLECFLTQFGSLWPHFCSMFVILDGSL